MPAGNRLVLSGLGPSDQRNPKELKMSAQGKMLQENRREKQTATELSVPLGPEVRVPGLSGITQTWKERVRCS